MSIPRFMAKQHSGGSAAKKVNIGIWCLRAVMILAMAVFLLHQIFVWMEEEEEDISNEGHHLTKLVARKKAAQLPIQPKEFKSKHMMPTGIYRYDNCPGAQHYDNNDNNNNNNNNIHNICTIQWPAIDLATLLPEELATTVDTEELQKQLLLPNYTYPDPEYVLDLPSSNNHSAVLTRTGFKGASTKANQDRVLLIEPFGDKHDFLMALFDGHGDEGHIVSHYAATYIGEILAEHLQRRDSSITDALSKTILQLDQTIPQNRGSGSTAIVIYRNQNDLYIANVGDSFAFLAEYDTQTATSTILHHTKPHKPADPKEKARIQSMGGTVHDGTTQDSSRVIIPIDSFQQLALAMSRSIGDHEGNAVGVIAEPTVQTIQLKPNQQKLFVVTATDGIFDRIPPEEVAAFIGTAMYGQSTATTTASASTSTSTSATPHRRLLDACEQLILRSSLAWAALGLQYRDDISIAVRRIS